MIRPAPRLVAALLVAFPGVLPAQTRQLLTRAELDAGGWTRLSELVFAVRGVSRTGVDGITVAGGIGGLPTYELAPGRTGWTVLVDDQPVALDVAGVAVLDLLPVALAQLDSVAFHAAPALVRGRVVTGGVLRVYTQRLRGARIQASFAGGNEAGDPGPFAYTPEATPNVDNMGPFMQLRGAYGAPSWDADVAVRRWTDNLTDPRLYRRYDAVAPGAELWVRHIAPTLRVGGAALGGRHDLQVGLAQLRGTFFVPAAREDESLRTRLLHVGLAGAFPHGSAEGAHYHLVASRLVAAPYDAPLRTTLAHTRDTWDAGVDVPVHVAGVRFTTSATAARRVLAGLIIGAGPARPDAHTEGDVAVRLEHPGRATVALSAGRGLAGARGGAVATVRFASAGGTSYLVHASGVARAVGDDGGWIDQALTGLSSLSTEPIRETIVGVDVTRAIRPHTSLEVGGTVRRHAGWRLVTPDSVATLPDLGTRTSSRLALTTGELRVGLALPPGSLVGGGLAYRVVAPLAGDAVARGAHRTVPRHLLDASVHTTPAFDIRVRAALALASRTRWGSAGPSSLDATVPATTRIDLGIEKWLLGRRVRAQIAARNLLNDVERHHPLGADFRLRVFAGATATF